MALSKGHKLGPYEIEEAAGAGGMGEVYKARDTRLDRTVAIKVLPTNFKATAEVKQRFEREAKAISSLNHPNICVLYDVGSENGTEYIVMEYLEGETLSARLSKGPLSTDLLLRYAVQIADALDKAHRQGLVHRDLKPGNVMLTADGAKLLDFGLAKLRIESGVVEGVSGITQTTPLTGSGTLLGTLQYMSPEQLEGSEADERSDIFAFGAVLYEMATGQKAFAGKSQASLIAGILEREPAPISQIAPLMPPALDRVVKKCLSKDPESRWQSARDLADELRWIAQAGSQAGVPSPISSNRRVRMRVGWAVAIVMTIASLLLAGMQFLNKEPKPQITRFEIIPRQGLTNITWPKISPDGSLIAFFGTDSVGSKKIYIRPMNSVDAYPLQGTEKAGRPFWSPDSKYLAYFKNNQLMKIPVSGGASQLICEVDGADGCWGSAGIIIFDGGDNDSIRQVSSAGGIATGATIIDREHGETSHAWPWFLPDGKHFLYTAYTDSASGSAWGNLILKVGSVSDNDDKVLTNVATRVEYSPTGHVLFVRRGTLLAQKFDPDKQELVGEPVPIAQDVATTQGARAFFSVSDNGELIYMAGDANVASSKLVWLDREGNELEQIGEPGNYYNVRLSPDETRLALQVYDDKSNQSDIWVMDLQRNVTSKLTFDPNNDNEPKWSPDGSRIYYNNVLNGKARIMVKAANGLTEPKVVYQLSEESAWVESISNDGKTIYMTVRSDDDNANADIWRMDPDDSSSAVAVIATPHNDWGPCISPDGKYLAYQSDETGERELFLLSLKSGQGKWQISAGGGGGGKPLWTADGKELIYYTTARDVMAVSVNTTGNSPQIGMPQKLFNRKWAYDISRDGSRFIFESPIGNRQDNKFTVVLNWNKEVEEK